MPDWASEAVSWGAASPLLLVGKKGPETLRFPPGAEPSRVKAPAFLPTALGGQGSHPGRVVF